VADRTVSWDEGSWLNPPPSVETDGTRLVVRPAEGSDFWRTTSYGFVHDDGHALLVDLPAGSAVEASFLVDYTELYDQAGVMLRVDECTWTKSGVEISDGEPQLGAVVTRGLSDWSLAPVPEWAGREVTVRASRSGDAVTLRARAAGEPWRMVRLAPLAPEAQVQAGPFCCSPSHGGLHVTFTGFRIGPADVALHLPAEDPAG